MANSSKNDISDNWRLVNDHFRKKVTFFPIIAFQDPSQYEGISKILAQTNLFLLKPAYFLPKYTRGKALGLILIINFIHNFHCLRR